MAHLPPNYKINFPMDSIYFILFFNKYYISVYFPQIIYILSLEFNFYFYLINPPHIMPIHY